RPRGSALLLLGVIAPREGSAELVEGEPVRQPVELGRALRADGSRNLDADRRAGHASGGWRRNRGDDIGYRTVPEGEEPPDQGGGDRYLRVRLQEIQGDGRLRQERDLSLHHGRHR